MPKDLESFKININGKILDYRLGKKLNLDEVRAFFAKKYTVKELWLDQRHVLGVLEKNGVEFFLKLATTEGISIVTKIEFSWNEEFNELVEREYSSFWVPKNYESSLYDNRLFYLITDKFEGELLSSKPEKTEASPIFLSYLPEIIDFSEFIQTLNIHNLSEAENINYQQWFINKAESWCNDIPNDIKEKYQIYELLSLVKNGASVLEKRPRHGDFTPWHLFKLKTGQLGLIDGEHAKANGVEYYDIGYFIQRVYCILENPELARKIFSVLMERNYDSKKLQTVLAARGIGGFLDESLKETPDYSWCESFKKWVISF